MSMSIKQRELQNNSEPAPMTEEEYKEAMKKKGFNFERLGVKIGVGLSIIDTVEEEIGEDVNGKK